MVVDARLVAGRGRHDRRCTAARHPTVRPRDRDRALHAGVLADGRVSRSAGVIARGHRVDRRGTIRRRRPWNRSARMPGSPKPGPQRRRCSRSRSARGPHATRLASAKPSPSAGANSSATRPIVDRLDARDPRRWRPVARPKSSTHLAVTGSRTSVDPSHDVVDAKARRSPSSCRRARAPSVRRAADPGTRTPPRRQPRDASLGSAVLGHVPMIGRYHRGHVRAVAAAASRLFDAPSPLAPLPRFSSRARSTTSRSGSSARTSCPLAFGGNKLRNLEFLVGAALADGADTLVTSGRRWSNHCPADRGRRGAAGLAVQLVLSGPAGRAARARASGSCRRSARRSTSWRPPIGHEREATVARRRGRRPGGGRAPVRDRRRGLRRARGATASRSPASSCLDAGRRDRPRRGLDRRAVGDGRDAGRADRRVRRPLAGDRASRAWSSPDRPSELRPAIASMRPRPGCRIGRPAAVDPTRDRSRRAPARRRVRPPDAPPPREAAALLARTEGDPGRPDLHGQGAGRPGRRRALRGRGTGSASCSGTPAGCPACSNRSTDPPAARPSLPGRPPRVAELHPARRLEHGPGVDPRADREQDPDRRRP